MKNTLEIDSIILEYGGNKILQDVFVKNETGIVTGLLGRNGTGKSSLMKIVYGDLNSTNKSIRINNKPLLGSKRSPNDMRFLPQGGFACLSFTLKSVMKDFRLDFTDFTQYFPNFEKYYHTKLKHLSSGERRIVEIYLILASSTKFCLLDEPFSKIMPLYIDEIKKLISREKLSKGIIISDHLYRHVFDVCDTIYVIQGKSTHLVNSIEEIESFGYANIN